MMNVEVHGKKILLYDISDQWGEEAYTFISRPELMHWVQQRFHPDKFQGPESERIEIIEAFKQV